ncbi:hypothetical protein EsH8_IX_001035 [Colletotrichum jinshuiense]
MDEFCVRLLSFFERGADGKPGKWPHATLSAEAMAGAGFRFQDSQTKSGDSVICDFCKIQAWRWEKKDDPFLQHREGSPHCDYVASKLFEDHHQVFLRGGNDKKEAAEAPPSPPPTPIKKSYTPRRRRLDRPPIVTVYDAAPARNEAQGSSGQQVESLSPVEISVSAGDTNIVIRVSEQDKRGGLASHSLPTLKAGR